MSAKTVKVPGKPKKGSQTREGYVLRNKMQKTIIVEVTRTVTHPQFAKIVRTKIRYAAHDPKEEAKVGDKVKIAQTKPLSKTKRWRLVEVLKK